MNLTYILLCLLPTSLCMAEKMLRSVYLRAMSTEKKSPHKVNQVLCVIEAFRSYNYYSKLSQMVLDTRSCTFIERHEEIVSKKTNFWEILDDVDCQMDQHQTTYDDTDTPTTTSTSLSTMGKPMERVIITLNTNEKTFEFQIGKHIKRFTFEMLGLKYITDVVYCPGSRKPLKMVAWPRYIYSFPFPMLVLPNKYKWKGEPNSKLQFFRCDTSGVIIPITNFNIYVGSWDGKQPSVTKLIATPKRLLTVVLEETSRMLYWTQSTLWAVKLYRIKYSKQQRSSIKEKVMKIMKVTNFVVDYYQQSIYACDGTLLRYTMSGTRTSKKGDPANSRNSCSTLALYEQDLYFHGRKRNGTLYHINSTKPASMFEVKHPCSKPCRCQVFEAPISPSMLRLIRGGK